MANLTSPGVQVQVIDESFYASSGPGTVPFIMMATAQDKPQPGNATSIAPGTIKANAGKLYRITSQRELLQTFGNPKFYTQAGTPQHGNELNEYGLYSAYQYLGLANSAYVMRADVDLGNLAPTGTEPVGEPVNGDYWLDLTATSWGLFRSNGNVNSGLAWGAVRPKVIDTATQLQRIVQCFRETQCTNPNLAIVAPGGNGTLEIADVVITIELTDTLNTIVQKINSNTTLTKKGIKAEIFSRLEKAKVVAPTLPTEVTVYNLRLVGSDITVNIDIGNAAPTTLLTALGFTNTQLPALPGPVAQPTNKPQQNYIVPVNDFGSNGDLAINAVSVVQGLGLTVMVPAVQIFEKVNQTTAQGTVSRWYPVGGTEDEYPGHSWAAASPTMVSSTEPVTQTFVTGTSTLFHIVAGVSTSITITVPAGTLETFVTSINTALASTQILATTYTIGVSKYLKLTDYSGNTVQLLDTTTASGLGGFARANMKLASTYYKSVTGSVVNPAFVTSTSQIITVTAGFGAGSVSANINVSAVSPLPTTIATVVAAINADPTVGLTNLIKAEATADNRLRIYSPTGTLFSLENVVGYATTAPLVSAGIPTGITYGNSLVYQGYSVGTPQPAELSQVAAGNIWVNTVAGNRGANLVVKRYNSGTDQWNTRLAPLYATDASANAGYGANRTVGSIYVRYNENGPDVLTQTGVLLVKIWDGTVWRTIPSYVASTVDFGDKYTQSSATPSGLPANGTLWYNANLRVDLMVSDGSTWLGYRNIYTATDPNGPTLSATAPTTQSGGLPLVDNDIWIDTSDLENYPKIYKRDAFNSQWLLVDNTDQSSSNGILFADARWTANGTSTGSQAIVDMLASDTVDPDAPSALPYPFGLLLYNTRYSFGNVKEYKVNYLPLTQQNNGDRNRWVTASGLMNTGAPYMLRKAQRQLIVTAMASALAASEELRSESNVFNLMAVPAYPELLDEMVTLNTDKKDVAFIVVDTPARLQPDGTSIQNWATNAANAVGNGEESLITATRYGGVYYPWGLATNIDGTQIFVPPSMTILRTIAFNDQVAYPWFAPAGFTRGLVSAVSSVGYLNAENEYVPIALSQGQRDTLYQNKINPIAFIPGRGLVVYGQKTLSPLSSALDRVNVARLINYLNYQLDILAKPFLFEPNDKQTRDSVARTFESFFGDLVGLRAVYDFAVVCDETNNSPTRIDRNELWIDVAVKPTKAIEFIYIPLRILNTGDPLP